MTRSISTMEGTNSSTSDRPGFGTNNTVFVCGFVATHRHNSSLQAVIQDLLHEYYVACNSDVWEESSATRSLLSNAEAMVFFVTESTLSDKTCLQNLQYAWHLMIPIIMLRPPRTKLVICKREQQYENIVTVGDGYVMRGPCDRWSLQEDPPPNIVDYNILQDILHEGYKQSVVYDRADHQGSMRKIFDRLRQVMRPIIFHESANAPAFYLSPLNGPNLTERAFFNGEISTERAVDRDTDSTKPLRFTRSMGNLQKTSPVPSHTQYPHVNRLLDRKSAEVPPIQTRKDSEESHPTHIIYKAPSPPHTPYPHANRLLERKPTEVPPSQTTKDSEESNPSNTIYKAPSTASRSSSTDRRISMGSLDDVSNYQDTQYIVFPIRNPGKKPTLIKFPEDLMEETSERSSSIWGSDTSLEEESAIAVRINSEMLPDDELDSTIGSPAPYIGDL